MHLSTILLNGLSVPVRHRAGDLLTAPLRYIVPTFLCGFAGRFVRDVCMGWGMSHNWSTWWPLPCWSWS